MAGVGQCAFQFRLVLHIPGAQAKAFSVLGVINLDEIAIVQAARFAVAPAKLIAQAMADQDLLMPVNGLEAVVLQQDDRQLDALLHRRLQLHGMQQIVAIAKKYVDLAVIRARQPHADRARNIVTHAGVAKFQVQDAPGGRFKELMQIARRRAGRAYQRIAGVHKVVERANHLRLTHALIRILNVD